jgi:hypothetical protein
MTFADIDDEGSALDAVGVFNEIGELGKQLDRKIVDRVEPKILEGFENGSLSGAA